MVGQVGEINGQRLAVPQAYERVQPQAPSEKRLCRMILKNVMKTLSADEIVVVDAGVKVSELQAATIEQYELRLASNFTARRNLLAGYCGVGRMPVYGELIRPLARFPTRYKVGQSGGSSCAQRFGVTWFYLTAPLLPASKLLRSTPSMTPILIILGYWQLRWFSNPAALETSTQTVGSSSKFL